MTQLTPLRRLRLAIVAFQKSLLQSKLLEDGVFSDWSSRRLRYEVNWAFYESTIYSDLNTWGQAYRTQYGMSRTAKPLYNPVFRLCEFWSTHIWGGAYDPELGNGDTIKTSLPFEFSDDKIREAVKQVYKWSSWQVKKDIVTLWGSVLGDVFIRVVDDADDKKVYFEIIHPGTISDLDTDARGNVKGYTLQEERIDPTVTVDETMVEYTEEVKLLDDGKTVQYTTWKGDDKFDWTGNGETWTKAYGFVPMVYIQNKDVGLDWGWSEFHGLRPKIHGLDETGSNLAEFIHQSVKSPWLFSGVKKPKDKPKTSATAPTAENPHPATDELRVLYAGAGATAQHLVSPLDIMASIKYLEDSLEEIERDFPELSIENWNAKGDVSARALRTARQRTGKKAVQRRASYDDALVRANMMALSIGALQGYKNFEKVPKDGYKTGAFDHTLLPRDVFEVDEIEDYEIEEAFWKAAETARRAGMSLLIWLKRKGWTEEEINELEQSEDYQNRIALQNLALDGGILNPGSDRGGPTSKEDKPVDKEV